MAGRNRGIHSSRSDACGATLQASVTNIERRLEALELNVQTILRLLENGRAASDLPNAMATANIGRNGRMQATLPVQPASLGDSECDEEIEHGDSNLQSPLLLEREFDSQFASTIDHLLEKLEEYGDDLQTELFIYNFTIDYGDEYLILLLEERGTYVLTKKTTNRQLWLSSPISRLSWFDWDQNNGAWVCDRSKKNLMRVLETELEQLFGIPPDLS